MTAHKLTADEVAAHLRNKRRAWRSRLDAADTSAKVACAAWDRARAAAVQAERRGRPEAYDELQKILTDWAKGWERWVAQHDSE